MSQENVEIVRRAFAYEVYGLGDRAEVEELFDPNVVMNATEEGPTHGLDEMENKWKRCPLLRSLYVARGQGLACG